MTASSAPSPYFGDASPPRNTALKLINQILFRMDYRQVEQALLGEESLDGGIYLCDLSLADWERYVISERQLLKARRMEWRDGKLFFVEPGSAALEWIKEAISSAFMTFHDHLACFGSTCVLHLGLIEPDTCFGPRRSVPGVCLPEGLQFGYFHTMKVEVGVARGWPALDRLATEWSKFPGVAYILCVRVSPDFKVRQYKLHQVDDGAIAEPLAAPTDITAPATPVEFDSHRLLGLPPTAPLPQGFAAPTLTIDLFYAVTDTLFEAELIPDKLT